LRTKLTQGHWWPSLIHLTRARRGSTCRSVPALGWGGAVRLPLGLDTPPDGVW